MLVVIHLSADPIHYGRMRGEAAYDLPPLPVTLRGNCSGDYGLQSVCDGSCANWSSVTPVGAVQRGPRFAGGTGDEIMAKGPALCSPLNGVGLETSNPQDS